MADVSAVVYSTKDNKKQARSITNIAPTATNAQIKAFAQACTALTTRTYVETYKIVKTNCDTEVDNNG